MGLSDPVLLHFVGRQRTSISSVLTGCDILVRDVLSGSKRREKDASFNVAKHKAHLDWSICYVLES